MEIKYFKLIKTITEEGSIANATNTLYLTQSAISHQLRELEERLGFKVFHRTRNQWKLTEEGEELYKLSITILGHIEKGFAHIDQLRKGSEGTIKVSTECYSFYQGLSSFIQKMKILYPKIQVDLILEATHQPIPKLLAQDIDIAIVTTKPKDKDLYSVAIYEDEIFAIIHQEHPLSMVDYLRAEDFSQLHLIIHSFPLETVSVYQHFLQPHKVTPLKISAIPLTEVALEMVNANIGITCMPKWALQAFKNNSNLVFKPISKFGLKRTHYLVCRTVDSKKRYIQDFIANFEEVFSQQY